MHDKKERSGNGALGSAFAWVMPHGIDDDDGVELNNEINKNDFDEDVVI